MYWRLALIALAAALVPATSFAQMTDGSKPFTVSVSPQYPRPFTSVTVTPTSNALSVTNASMQLLVNGKQFYTGNATPVQVFIGALGSVTTIKAIVSSMGTKYETVFTIRPQDISLIVEPNSSVPPLYPGTAFLPIQGTARLVAIADLRDTKNKPIPPSAISYAWSIDDTRFDSASGIGKDTFVASVPAQYRSSTVSVTAQSLDGKFVTSTSADLEAVEPFVRMYETDPLLGVMFDRAIGASFGMAGAQKTFFGAVFAHPTTAGEPQIKWFLNGTLAQTGPLVTLRPTGSGAGSASLSMQSSGGENLSASTQTTVTFGTSAAKLGIFGL